MEKTDSELQQAVLQELKANTRVRETEVGVAVKDGVVTLSGVVDSFGKRLAAQEAAHRVAGVLDVANDLTLKIRGTAVATDTEIAAAVRHALEWNVLVPDERIRSTVSGGWVTLEGEVDYWTEREDAQQAVRNLKGVKGISNKLEIRPASANALSEQIRKAIEEALERRAERHAKRIEITVKNGIATLNGIVHSWPERQAVIHAAGATAGVRTVEDRLRIEPYAR